MENFSFTDLVNFISWPYMAVFVLLSFVIKKAFGDLLQKITKFEWQPVFTVLILATIFGLVFGFAKWATWMQVLITYCIGTSLYETILEYFFKKVQGILK